MNDTHDEISFPNGTLPKKNIWLHLLLSMPQLMYFDLYRSVIKKYFLPYAQNIDFIPGFNFLFGNIYTEGSSVCDTFFVDYAPIHLGKNSKFSFGNKVITSTHDLSCFTTVKAKPINIGENVWITSGCIILGGVTIGKNSIIAAGSVVASDIPANCIAGGNPAKVIRYLEHHDTPLS